MADTTTPYADGQVLDGRDANMLAGFGDGSDGEFNETGASTTNLVQGTVYQYTSFTLGADHTISAESTSSKPIIILVSGNCTINGKFDLSGKGATANYQDDDTYHRSYSTTGVNWGTNGRDNNPGDAYGGTDFGGKKGLAFMNYLLGQKSFIMNGTAGGAGATAGASRGGGGGGASSSTDGGNGDDGSAGVDAGSVRGLGGPGGCTLFIKVGGTLTFGAASEIDCSGADGNAATGGDYGGGGGGGSGDVIIIHKGAKTDNGLTTVLTGGAAGAGAGNGGDGGVGAAGNETILDWSTVLF